MWLSSEWGRLIGHMVLCTKLASEVPLEEGLNLAGLGDVNIVQVVAGHLSPNILMFLYILIILEINFC